MRDTHKRLRAQRAELVQSRKDSPKYVGAIRRCFATEDGKWVLVFLRDLCGWEAPGVGGNASIGADVLMGTLYNEAQREVYAALRSMIPREILKEIEFHTDSQDGEED